MKKRIILIGITCCLLVSLNFGTFNAQKINADALILHNYESEGIEFINSPFLFNINKIRLLAALFFNPTVALGHNYAYC